MSDFPYPEPVVGLFIFNPDEQLLTMRSHKWRDAWVIPGGHIDAGETMVEAAVRESKEETGLDIYDVEIFYYQDFIYEEAFYKKKHFLFIEVACKTDSREVTLNWEGQEYKWRSPEEALKTLEQTYTAKALKILLEQNLQT